MPAISTSTQKATLFSLFWSNSAILTLSLLWSTFIIFRGNIAPEPVALPSVTALLDDNRLKALVRKPGCSVLVSVPAATNTDGLRGLCGTYTGGSVSGSFLSSGLCPLFLSNGLPVSTLGLFIGDFDLDESMLGVRAGALPPDSLCPKFVIHELRRLSFFRPPTEVLLLAFPSSTLGPRGVTFCEIVLAAWVPTGFRPVEPFVEFVFEASGIVAGFRVCAGDATGVVWTEVVSVLILGSEVAAAATSCFERALSLTCAGKSIKDSVSCMIHRISLVM